MAAVDDAAWLELVAAQRRAGFLLGPADPVRPSGLLAAVIQAERAALVSVYNLAVGGK